VARRHAVKVHVRVDDQAQLLAHQLGVLQGPAAIADGAPGAVDVDEEAALVGVAAVHQLHVAVVGLGLRVVGVGDRGFVVGSCVGCCVGGQVTLRLREREREREREVKLGFGYGHSFLDHIK
jgi:hypothetical protein